MDYISIYYAYSLWAKSYENRTRIRQDNTGLVALT